MVDEAMAVRVAKAMAKDAFSRSLNDPEVEEDYVALVHPTMLPLANAAIKAMREPTAAMLAVGPPEPYMDADVWAKMIDAATT